MMWRRSIFLLMLGAGVAVDACGSSTFSSDDGGSDASTGNDAIATGDAASDAPSVQDSSSDGSLPTGTIVLISGQDNPHDIVARNGRIFWTNYSEVGKTGSIMSSNVDGTDIVKLGGGQHANRLAVDDTHVYWSEVETLGSNDSNVNASQLDGGGTTPLMPSLVNPMGIAIDDANVYAVTTYGISGSGNIIEYSKAGDFVQNIATSLDNPVSVAVDSHGIVWTQLGVGLNNGQVIAYDLDGGVVTVATNLAGPWGLTITSGAAYFTNLVALDSTVNGTLGTLPRTAGANASFILNGAGPRPYFIANDAANVYWTEEGSGPANGAVRYGAPTSTNSVTVATGQQRPHGIAVDANYIYWTSYSSGKIFRSPKP